MHQTVAKSIGVDVEPVSPTRKDASDTSSARTAGAVKVKPMAPAKKIEANSGAIEVKRIPPERENVWRKKAALRDAKKKTPPRPPPSSAGMVWRKKSPPPTKYLFMFFSYPSGSTAHQLYAAKVFPESSSNMKPQPVEQVLSFPSKDFPVQMSCVHFDSKLYFIGGNRVHSLDLTNKEWNNHPRDVYVLDPCIVHKPESDRSIDMLKKVCPMNTGKPTPYALVANRKIYVISPRQLLSTCTMEKVSRFEVFHPFHNVWVTLQEPPDLGAVTGHAVVGRKILFSASSRFSDEVVVYYDAKFGHWGSVSSAVHGFYGVAHYVDDIFYACCQHMLVAYTSGTGGWDFDGLPDFDCCADAELEQEYNDVCDVIDEADNLIHLGDQTFCCLKLYDDDKEGFVIKIAAFKASHGADHDFLADIFSVSELAVHINSGIRPELLAFSDIVSVPFAS